MPTFPQIFAKKIISQKYQTTTKKWKLNGKRPLKQQQQQLLQQTRTEEGFTLN